MSDNIDNDLVPRDGAEVQDGDTGKPAECGGGCCRARGAEPRCKLHSHNWLADIPGGYADSEWVEVTFKNTRKGYYKNSNHIPLEPGDIVAVEATPGHDIGTVTLTGILVEMRMKRNKLTERNERRTRREKTEMEEVRRVFRKARPADLERYEEARARENDTMIRARRIAADLGLNMKIGDVEYQGDGNKAIFYYISDERVDFRQLIKVLAETFKVRIEMKQIGARQEAGRIGGIGPCGRPLCCSVWMSNFVSVATSAARHQDLSLNPQKLAGQCAKLKCCLNFEVDTYVESSRGLPEKNVRLETVDGTFFHFKTDVLKREITYSSDKNVAANLVTISAARAREIIAMNQRGEKPDSLIAAADRKEPVKAAFGDILGDDDLTRFDKKKKKRRNKGAKAKAGSEETTENNAQQPTEQPKRPKKKKRPAKDKDGNGGTPQASAPAES
ncbi:MAG: hypothetical protein K2M19_09195 [Muribaculaceae bacterium]|nr:hypothetical protein [Muribaculaceae bacterium]